MIMGRQWAVGMDTVQVHEKSNRNSNYLVLKWFYVTHSSNSHTDLFQLTARYTVCIGEYSSSPLNTVRLADVTLM